MPKVKANDVESCSNLALIPCSDTVTFPSATFKEYVSIVAFLAAFITSAVTFSLLSCSCKGWSAGKTLLRVDAVVVLNSCSLAASSRLPVCSTLRSYTSTDTLLAWEIKASLGLLSKPWYNGWFLPNWAAKLAPLVFLTSCNAFSSPAAVSSSK